MPSILERVLEPFCQDAAQPGDPGRDAFHAAFSVLYGYIGPAAWETRKIQLADALNVSPFTLQRWADRKATPHYIGRPAILRSAIRAVSAFC